MHNEGLVNLVARFIMLFRSLEGELCSFFEDEGLSFNEWVLPWMQTFLAKELCVENVLRLWDTYFSVASDPTKGQSLSDLHLFVCLSLLRWFKMDLMELDYSEIKSFLRSLPPVDMEQIIVQAHNIREEIKQMGI